jgi:hypothetical protein
LAKIKHGYSYLNHDYRQLITHAGQWRGDPDSLSDRLLETVEIEDQGYHLNGLGRDRPRTLPGMLREDGDLSE